MKKLILTLVITLTFVSLARPQIPTTTLIQITKAEDARRYDATLVALMKSPNPLIRERASLAAGRIGDERAIPALAALLEDLKNSGRVWTMAVFALGEIESIKGAEHVIDVIKAESGYINRNHELLSRAFEAAGKIAAANAKDPKAKEIGEVILKGLELEQGTKTQYSDVIRSALTAVLRARPVGGENAVQPLLASTDPYIIADALNTLTRLKAKNSHPEARGLLAIHVDPIVRANAARALGAAEDKEAIDVLQRAAVSDDDPRVRVSAIRALGNLKDAKSGVYLVAYGEALLLKAKRERGQRGRPVSLNELIDIATACGRLLPNSNNERVIRFLDEVDKAAGYRSPEVKIALAQVSPKGLFDNYGQFNRDYKLTKFPMDWRIMSALVQGFGELAKLPETDANKALRERAMTETAIWIAAYYRINLLTWADAQKPANKEFIASQHGLIFRPDHTRYRDVYLPLSDILTAYAAFKPDGLSEILLNHLQLDDVIIRATAAGLIADRPASKENFEALKKAFVRALLNDKNYNDAQLATLEALNKLDKKESAGMLVAALNAPDYLVRKKAFELLADKDLLKDLPGMQTSLDLARTEHRDQVLPYTRTAGTRLGQVLNTDADYRRTLSRKNGSVKAVLTTEKGVFTIVFNPEDAPLTVDNFIKLARSGYFNGLEVHRVVPNFVLQDGDPRGDGNGGPSWSIRCEINMLPYDRGAVGMALSGKDTGGSQWFVTHSPQPHLDGGYTVFGHVNETDMKVVDNIVRGDKIISVRIVEGISPRKGAKSSK